jgi:hypothetical protein
MRHFLERGFAPPFHVPAEKNITREERSIGIPPFGTQALHSGREYFVASPIQFQSRQMVGLRLSAYYIPIPGPIVMLLFSY